MGNRWLEMRPPGVAESYDEAFERLAAEGKDVHGEASFVEALSPRSVLDAGCGTGRVGIELARRGFDVAGVDLDEEMLEVARRKAPHLPWVLDDLATMDLRDETGAPRRFDVIIAAGNVMIFLTPGTEAQVIANLARHLAPGGALVAGFSTDASQPLSLDEYDRFCDAAGLRLEARYATWDRDAWTPEADYALSVHRAP